MEFCPKCGRYLKDDEFKCPECGNMVRSRPEEELPPQFREPMQKGQETFDFKKTFTEKWFFIALGIGFAAAFSVTYFWRFSFLFFCFPLFLPTGRMSIALGAVIGICLGSVAAFLVKTYLITSSIIV